MPWRFWRQRGTRPPARVVAPGATAMLLWPDQQRGVVGGAESQQGVVVHGVSLPVVDTVVGAATADGRASEHDSQAYATLGDGTVTQHLNVRVVCAGSRGRAPARSAVPNRSSGARHGAPTVAMPGAQRAAAVSTIPACRASPRSHVDRCDPRATADGQMATAIRRCRLEGPCVRGGLR